MITNDWARQWAKYSAGKVAAEEFETGRSLTYSMLNQLSVKYVNYLTAEFALKKGDRIAILAENCLEYVILLSVAQKTGIILVPLNYRLTPREIDFLIHDSDPDVLIVESKFRDKIKDIPSTAQVSHLLDLAVLQQKTGLFSSEPFSDHPEQSQEGTTHDDPALIIYTSGTTAFPKGSVYTHGMMFWNSLNTQLRLDITSADRSVNLAPPFHTGNWNVLLTPFLHHGAYTLIMKSFDADKVLEALEKYNLTIFWAVPTMLKMMSDSPLFDRADLSRIRYFVVGGEAMPVPLIGQWHAKGVPIRQGYGLTEVGPNVTSLNHQDAIRKAGSIGKENFYYQAKLVNDSGDEVAPGELGELVLSGPTVTPGYWRNPEATAATIRDGWFHTGDIMRRDEEGFLFVVDRIKNMYISGAENVYPAEVEFLLRSHPGIDSVAIIGVPDEKWGESGMAFVVTREGFSVTKEDVLTYCEGKLAKYKIPKHVHFLDELPRNDAGKIDRQQLRIISTLNQ
ncbi:long-chain fatty acid--CoA ligase [Lentimicrobium sp.]|jgi:fatty-acyl-CoA synthase|uniref:acyl-CoA synthetase n=1 Tax=Lentimicrobium sp. TaxID=2034841 RepID=UPI0025D31AB8|nr:long-chain fatty acid--CoA ligase [Lentimicrobium sp.]MCO5255334.1 long-chain fatty acid--CoA ligase [Lentimicrobium sp.]MCO5264115.1 long-chain fatty acid--CoA ligase [Lentimicrobium sp.]HPF65199.1 long-chain fatty acid--CoA ligase [Lentimicrobium sp.]HPJ62926.1 long-chain fatty acid--CoA ligase [Lentimicrobium sp.]HPR26901.1 long-chain fatty acid--CoA ligase [Lentimicrobium sp.]